MNDAAKVVAPPKSFWVIAAVSLLWNAYGGFDYTMTRMRNMEFLTQVAGSADNARQMLAMIDAFPVWASIGWGAGVWGSVFGSILLLLRSRWAVTAFVVSIAGAVVSFAYQLTSGAMPTEMNNPAGWAFTAVIVGAVVFFWWFAKRAAARGILR